MRACPYIFCQNFVQRTVCLTVKLLPKISFATGGFLRVMVYDALFVSIIGINTRVFFDNI